MARSHVCPYLCRPPLVESMPPSLASRLLFHAQPGQPPPPLLLDPRGVAPELTPEIYDFIALALRAPTLAVVIVAAAAAALMRLLGAA